MAGVRPNLLAHASGWPTGEDLQSRVYSGQPAYGMAATGPDRMSEGATALVQAADRTDERPLWVAVWGGSNTLAQALLHVRATRSPDQAGAVRGEVEGVLDLGPGRCRAVDPEGIPELLYVVQPSTQTGADYYYATWTGISGDVFYPNCAGADTSVVTNEWLDANIRSKGALGRLYPRFLFIMEGDTPSFLALIDNGLNGWRRPDWGGWGGRYMYRQPYGETHPIWTQGGDLSSRVTSQDEVTGSDGRKYVSDQVTIWRWRETFQNDFAARMRWTVNDYAHANHGPEVVVNGQDGTAPIFLDVVAGKPVVLDASRSKDPDGNGLRFHWFHYGEAGAMDESHAAVMVSDSEQPKEQVSRPRPRAARGGWTGRRVPRQTGPRTLC